MIARRRIAIVAVAAVLLVCGCTSSSDSGGPSTHAGHDHDAGQSLPAGDGPVIGGGPDATAREALSRIYSWQPVSDADSSAAILRAAAWLDADLLAKILSSREGGRGIPQWALWREGTAIVTAQVAITARRDKPTAQRVRRVAMVAQQVQWPDGGIEELPVMTFAIALHKDTDGRWLLSSLEVAAMP